MFDTYGTINVNNKNIEIEKLSVEELKKYSKMLEEQENKIIVKQNEYLAQLLG